MSPLQASQKSPAFQAVLTIGEKRSLRRRFFKDVTFERVDFSRADFRLSNFSNVTFRQCDLTNADLRGTEFKTCVFLDCDLAAIRFGRNRFIDTDFRRCRNLLADQRQRLLAMGGRWIGSLRD